MKKNYVIFFIIISILLIGCASTNNSLISSFVSQTGINLFLRPVKCTPTNKTDLKECILDITVTNSNEIVTINYTITKQVNSDLNNGKLLFKCNNSEYITQDNTILYKEKNGKNLFSYRYSSTLSRNDFICIINNIDDMELFVKNNSTISQLDITNLKQSLIELSFYIL